MEKNPFNNAEFSGALVDQDLEHVFEAMADGVWVCDATPKLLWINSACEELNSIRREEVCGKSVSELLDQGNFDTDVTHRVLREKQPVAIIQKVKSGRTLLVNGVPIFDNNGNVRFVVGSERDLTELNMLREELEQKDEINSKIHSELLTMKLRDRIPGVVVAASDQMDAVMETVLRVANFDTSVLLTGPSGTGKSMIARLIHDGSNRRDMPFMTLNCGAIPAALAEAELFGYTEGAFTGALKGGKIGLIEAANGGSLFLDEIDAFSMDIQVKLLTFLDTREFLQIGGRRVKTVDVRLIAASNRDLEQLVQQGSFREDLWYRLNVVPILVPPLAERRDDILPLVSQVLEKLSRLHGESRSISRDALEILERYDYPGNVRELENILEQSYVLCDQPEITVQHLPGKLKDTASLQPTGPQRKGLRTGTLQQTLDLAEKEFLHNACRNFRRQTDIARSLGVSQPTVARLLKKHQLKPARTG